VTQPPVVPLPAACVLLLRDCSAGVEVFMTLRHPRLSFSQGALVFPGGKVDPADADPRLRPFAPGADGLSDLAFAARVAALRELFEEAGVLIARHRDGRPVPADRASVLARRWRRLVHDGDATMLDMARQENLLLPLDALASFAHWITPERSPRRFDTYFFLAAAPAGAEPRHDGREAVESLWLHPDRALADAAAGSRPILFPTRATLSKLARSRSVAEAFASATAFPVRPVSTCYVERDGRTVMRIPDDLGYTFTEMPARD
jgi:8-oxo-dGTP pyrophosphatase MutT (NUDIX family)